MSFSKWKTKKICKGSSNETLFPFDSSFVERNGYIRHTVTELRSLHNQRRHVYFATDNTSLSDGIQFGYNGSPSIEESIEIN